jgi:hypothetical protein
MAATHRLAAVVMRVRARRAVFVVMRYLEK